MISELAGADEPFFHQRAAKSVIDELGKLTSVTIYVGAGASIERTGLTWTGLNAQLMDKDLGTYERRIALVRSHGELASASSIAREYERTHADNALEFLTQGIRELLYSGSGLEQSYFNDRVIALANDYMRAGEHVVVVTPNYDDFLIDSLRQSEDKGTAEFERVAIFGFGVTDQGEATPLSDELIRLKAALREPKTLSVVYLHGVVPRTRDPLAGNATSRIEPLPQHVYPVFSESDYAATRANSGEILTATFSGRDLLVVGTSLTDPPLLHALSVSKDTVVGDPKRHRFVIRPLQGLDLSGIDDEAFASFQQVQKDRSDHLGVRLVTPPFFFQVPQLLEEVRVAIDLDLGIDARPRAYSESGSTPRYGERLNQWWRAWKEDEDVPLTQRQYIAHSFLDNVALPSLRAILQSPDEEDLRLEAWIRWEPNSRHLRLWASSTGTWPDTESARWDSIGMGGTYGATLAFLNGAPTYAAGLSERTRWGSFLSKPVRYENETRYLQIGVISLASKWPQSDSSVNPRNKENRAALLAFLDYCGKELFTPGRLPDLGSNASWSDASDHA